MGTVKLLSGLERPYNPLDYITKESGTHLAPKGAPCPLWMAFLNRITAGNDA